MLKGILLGAIMTLLVVFAYWNFDCRKVFLLGDSSSRAGEFITALNHSCRTVSPINRRLDDSWYQWRLSRFQEYSDGRLTQRRAEQRGDDKYEFIRIVYMPFPGPDWYFYLDRSHGGLRPDVYLTIKKHDVTKQTYIEENGAFVGESIIDEFYPENSIESSSFEKVIDDLAGAGFFNEREQYFNFQLQGMSYDIEVLIDGNWKRISRRGVDAAFAEDFVYAESLLNLVRQEIPDLADEIETMFDQVKNREQQNAE